MQTGIFGQMKSTLDLNWLIRVITSSNNCLEEFDGSNLKPAVALSATGVVFLRSFGTIASDFWSNSSIECDPWKNSIESNFADLK